MWCNNLVYSGMADYLYNLFGERDYRFVETEGIKYIGSKARLIPYILRVIDRVKPRVVLDGFSGTTRVSQALAQCGYRVISNDIAVWSRVFGVCYLLADRGYRYYRGLVDYLNGLRGEWGWFTENYGGGEGDRKCVWQLRNAMKLDAVRGEIDRMGLDDVDRCVLLSSLMLGLDRVDSTVGHFCSYLRDWSLRSYGRLELVVPRFVGGGGYGHEVYCGDIFDLLGVVSVDLAYYDPPYGSCSDKMPSSRVRYGGYYHLWETVVLNDRPRLFGSVGRRVDSSDRVRYSVFEDYRVGGDGRYVVAGAFERLVRETRASYVLLSYSSGGRLGVRDLLDICSMVGRVVLVESVVYRRNVMVSMCSGGEWATGGTRGGEHVEYLILVEK